MIIRIITWNGAINSQIEDVREFPIEFTKDGKFNSMNQAEFKLAMEQLKLGLKVSIELVK